MRWLFIVMIAITTPAVLRADVFILANSGQLRGELLNKSETPRKNYVIRTSDGGELTLDKAQVKEVVPQTAAQLEYANLAPTYRDTVEDQWQLAEWCRENQLKAERQIHLERIIELEPNHKMARALLGYTFVDGEWGLPKEHMENRGYVLYQGKWMTPQEVAIVEQRRKDELAQKAWIQKVKRYREQLGNRDPVKVDQAKNALLAIRDPYAVPAIKDFLQTETEQSLVLLLVDILSSIGTEDAWGALAVKTIEDPSIEIRLACLEKLQGHSLPRIVAYYLSDHGLKSKDNVRVNRAGFALGKLKDPTTVTPLVAALITAHKFKVQSGPPPGSTTTTFSRDSSGGGGGGIAVGGGQPKIITQHLQNNDVLESLTILTGQDYGFDVAQWNKWLATQKRPENIAGRRDEKK